MHNVCLTQHGLGEALKKGLNFSEVWQSPQLRSSSLSRPPQYDSMTLLVPGSIIPGNGAAVSLLGRAFDPLDEEEDNPSIGFVPGEIELAGCSRSLIAPKSGFKGVRASRNGTFLAYTYRSALAVPFSRLVMAAQHPVTRRLEPSASSRLSSLCFHTILSAVDTAAIGAAGVWLRAGGRAACEKAALVVDAGKALSNPSGASRLRREPQESMTRPWFVPRGFGPRWTRASTSRSSTFRRWTRQSLQRGARRISSD